MKLVMIYDQIQSGAGIKDDKMIGLNITKEKVGPAVMMEKSLKEHDATVIATLYCGNGYYVENKDEVVRKLTAMVGKLKPDAVICGPSFNYLEYSNMCANVATEIVKSGTPAICAMSVENEDTINEFKDQVTIVKCPKKGGTGLSNTLKILVESADELVSGKAVSTTEVY